MNMHDVIALDHHRARDHMSEILPTSASWTKDDAIARWLGPVLADEAPPPATDGTYQLSRVKVGELLHSDRLTSAIEQVILVYAWGGSKHGNNFVAANASRTQTSRVSGKPHETHSFLLDPRQSRTATPGSALVDPYNAFDKLWNPSDRSNGVLKGMGTPYGTKVLYWAVRAFGGLSWTEAVPHPIPLVYDMHVHRALCALGLQWTDSLDASVGGGGGNTFDDPSGRVRYAAYEAYCRFAWLAANRLNAVVKNLAPNLEPFHPDDVEYWLFCLGGSAQDPVNGPVDAIGGYGPLGGVSEFDDDRTHASTTEDGRDLLRSTVQALRDHHEVVEVVPRGNDGQVLAR